MDRSQYYSLSVGKKCPSVDEVEAWFMEEHQGKTLCSAHTSPLEYRDSHKERYNDIERERERYY